MPTRSDHYIRVSEYGEALSGGMRVETDYAIAQAISRYAEAQARREANPDFADRVPGPTRDPETYMTKKSGHTLGRCRNCERRDTRVGWAWKSRLGNLSTMRCPRCGLGLDQTTLTLSTHFWLVPDEVTKTIVAKVKAMEEAYEPWTDDEAENERRTKAYAKARDAVTAAVQKVRDSVEAPIVQAREEANKARDAELAEAYAKRRMETIQRTVYDLSKVIGSWGLTGPEVDAIVANAKAKASRY